MSTQDNKALVRRIFDEVINQRNVVAADEIFAADVRDHTVPPGLPPGRDGLKANFGAFLAAFPDLSFTVEDMIAEGDQVVTRRTFRGTHQGPLFGIPPTGRPVTVTGIDISRVEAGKVVEHWGNEDDLGMLQQLGVVPAPGS